jgi:SagB-type dehydrogenase family enzyme
MGGIAGAYHEKTGYERSKMGGHFLDWQNQPAVFKAYEGLETIPMPRQMPLPQRDFFSLYGGSVDPLENPGNYDLETLSKILLLTYTLTSQSRHSGGTFYFRSAASAGALYPTEVYVLSNGLRGLDDGLYHFSIATHGLVKLRHGRFSRAESGFMHDGASEGISLTFFLTAIFFRSAWKYRTRSYRYHLLDTGHVLENLDLSLKALNLPYEITFDFEDRSVNHLLGLDENREAALALCRVKGSPRSSFETKTLEDLPETVKNASRVSPREFDAPEVLRLHRAGYDRMAGTADFNMCRAPGLDMESGIPMPTAPLPEADFEYPEAVFRRRSGRNFVPETLSLSRLRALLKVVSSSHTLCTGFLTNGVESLEDGFYVVHGEAEEIGLVKRGALTSVMSRICLNQEWMANAALHFLFMSDLDSLERSWGPRGYRYAMMTAGLMGERYTWRPRHWAWVAAGSALFTTGRLLSCWVSLVRPRVLYVVPVGTLKSRGRRDALL